MFALAHIGPKLRSKSVLWFIDNLGVLSCYCKGASATADIACVVHASLLMMAALRVRSWYEHVDSKANASDGGTRGQTKAGSIVLRDLLLPQWPKHAASTEPAVWLTNWDVTVCSMAFYVLVRWWTLIFRLISFQLYVDVVLKAFSRNPIGTLHCAKCTFRT